MSFSTYGPAHHASSVLEVPGTTSPQGRRSGRTTVISHHVVQNLRGSLAKNPSSASPEGDYRISGKEATRRLTRVLTPLGICTGCRWGGC